MIELRINSFIGRKDVVNALIEAGIPVRLRRGGVNTDGGI
jgi:hypothetical protein